ncbi:cell division cycle-associated 7-like protein [Carex littledalei]|uniref:Cell division cycle-associated 7-like protein n=1 Tax=Carex littledalei TaxID=544730 RepID=A0A833QPY7_9POAL|nr:cell division cycle-associated 7-like protein [Carex littledalei]
MKSEAMDYEKCREERIKSNMERMQQLGILNLSRHVNTAFKTPNSRRVLLPTDGTKKKVDLITPPLPSRRSSRLQNVAPVNYIEAHGKKSNDLTESEVAFIEEGRREELYTEEHDKLLGSCEASWTLFVDGYGNDNKRIYDPVKGKTCHQCRQKTMGYRTSCCKCQIVQGQFCGDCLYMRYGENVLEAIKNPDWMCPVCRGICNCSLCRLKKGWNPTGPLYKKVVKLGYKSVAHYLIQTRQKPAKSNSEIKGAMSDNTEASNENEPKPEIIISEKTDESIVVVSSTLNDGENMGKRRRQVKRKKEEGHTGNLSPSPGPIATRLRRRLYGI